MRCSLGLLATAVVLLGCGGDGSGGGGGAGGSLGGAGGQAGTGAGGATAAGGRGGGPTGAGGNGTVTGSCTVSSPPGWFCNEYIDATGSVLQQALSACLVLGRWNQGVPCPDDGKVGACSLTTPEGTEVQWAYTADGATGRMISCGPPGVWITP
jgi:hypothetical protein